MRERDLVGRFDRFVAEGKVVLNVLFTARRFQTESVLLLDKRWAGMADTLALKPHDAPVYVAGQAIMDAIAGFHIHRGILAIGRKGERPDPAAMLRGLPHDALVVVLAGIIVLVPGLSFTVALIELTTRHLMSGTARLAGAGTVFLTLAFGVATGRGLVALAWERAPTVEVDPLPEWASYVALPVAAWAFSVLLKARRRELGWILLAATAGLTNISFDTASAQQVRISLVDVVGRVVVFVADEHMGAGTHRMELDLSSIPAGVYFLRVEVGGSREVQAITIVR